MRQKEETQNGCSLRQIGYGTVLYVCHVPHPCDWAPMQAPDQPSLALHLWPSPRGRYAPALSASPGALVPAPNKVNLSCCGPGVPGCSLNGPALCTVVRVSSPLGWWLLCTSSPPACHSVGGDHVEWQIPSGCPPGWPILAAKRRCLFRTGWAGKKKRHKTGAA